MNLSDAFILGVGQLLVTQETSSIGLIQSGWLWGRIQLVGQNQDTYKIGGKVAYDPTHATQMTFQEKGYFFVQEPYVIFQINPTL